MKSWIAVPLALVGCGGAVESVSGTPGSTVAAQFAGNVTFAPITLDGSGGRALLDTGSPFTILAPATFPGSSSSVGNRVRASLGLGDLTVDNADVYETLGSGVASNLVGVDTLVETSIAFDRRDGTVRFGDGAAPGGIDTTAKPLSFKLAGGGEANLGGNFHYPATRILVTATVEGAPHTFVFDTGASQVILRSTLMAALVADGRPQIAGPPVTTLAEGQLASTVTRVKSLSVAGQEVDDLIALSIGDDLLDTISTEVGQTLDGILGGDFHREFFLTVDYPRGELTYAKWDDRSFLVDDFQRIGVQLGGPSVGSIAFVYAGSDADKQGLAVGDVVVSIDGTSVGGLDPLVADDLLKLPVGSSHTLLVDKASAPNEPVSVTVLSDDLVPKP